MSAADAQDNPDASFRVGAVPAEGDFAFKEGLQGSPQPLSRGVCFLWEDPPLPCVGTWHAPTPRPHSDRGLKIVAVLGYYPKTGLRHPVLPLAVQIPLDHTHLSTRTSLARSTWLRRH